MTEKSRVYIVHKDATFTGDIAAKLEAQNFTVSKKHTLAELDGVLGKANVATCLLIQIDLSQYSLFDLHSLLTRCASHNNIYAILLVPDKGIMRLIEPFAHGNITVLIESLTAENLVRKVIKNGFGQSNEPMPQQGKLLLPKDELPSTNGSTPRFVQMLDFCTQVAFTGKLIVNHPAGEGSVELKKGRIEFIHYRQLSQTEALRRLSKLKNASYSLQQKSFTMDDVNSYLQHREHHNNLSMKDIVIDLFYFMHTRLESLVAIEIIRLVVDKQFRSFSESGEGNAYLIYNDDVQEKIQIIGELTPPHAGQVVALFQRIYDELLHPAFTEQFTEFVDSLDEIQPYLQELDRFVKFQGNGQATLAIG